MPQFSWMGNNSHGFGGSGSMFNLAGNNAGFNLGYKPPTNYETTETDAAKTLKDSEEATGGAGVSDAGGEPKPGEVIGQGFKDAGNIISNMYSGSSGSIFS